MVKRIAGFGTSNLSALKNSIFFNDITGLGLSVGSPTLVDFSLTNVQIVRLDSVKGATMTTLVSTSNNRRMILTSAAILAVGVGAYGLGRVYPPLGPSAGTIGAAQRYVNSQIGDKDVTLGDTSVPELMQTDAFEAMVHNPAFRTLAKDANFQALAQNPVAMAALAQNAPAFQALANNPAAFGALAQAAQQMSANNGAANAVGTQAAAALAVNADSFKTLASQPGAIQA